MNILKEEYKKAIDDCNRIDNQFNNTTDHDLLDVLIHERKAIVKKIDYLTKKIKEKEVV